MSDYQLLVETSDGRCVEFPQCLVDGLDLDDDEGCLEVVDDTIALIKKCNTLIERDADAERRYRVVGCRTRMNSSGRRTGYFSLRRAREP